MNEVTDDAGASDAGASTAANEAAADAARAANADPAELRKFGDLAARWWDPEGPMKTLHDINPLRCDYIEQRVALDGTRVLDVGCGGGILSEALARRGARVLGVDLAAENVEAARAHAAPAGVAAEYRHAGVEAIAKEQPGSFDVVTCLELLEHVPDPESAVRACAAAVRPGGAVFFSTINRNTKSFLLAIVGAEYLLGMVPKGTHDYRRLIRPSELAGACRRAGLDMRALTGLHYNPLTRGYRLGGNVDVNYIAHTVRTEHA